MTQPRQLVRPHKPITIAIEEVAPTTNIVDLVDAYQQEPFDLERDALLRMKLLHFAPDEHVLLLNMHHIIADGWSATIFMRELRQAYAAFLADEDWQPTPLPIQYHDFACWQRQWLTGELLDQQTAYWSQQLAGELPIIDLPMDAQRPPQQTFAGEKLSIPLPTELSAALRQLSQTQNATLFMTMLAGFKLWLHRLTKLTDLIVGIPIANRNQQETEALIGFFANTLVLRTSLTADAPFTDLLQTVRETTLGAYAHQDLPFERLVELFQVERDLSRPPLFQLFFNMINMADYGKFELPDLETERVENGRIVSKFDLTMYILDDGEALNLELVYNCDLFSAERMTTWLAQYVTLLKQVVAQPNQSLNQFSLQTSPNLLPDPAVPLFAESFPLVHQRLTETAKAQPNQLALVSEHAEWTYAKLELYSNQLAHYLLDNGIGKGDLVAVAATRSPELVASLLAIHKAGAAFAILDMTYPSSRLVQYLEQAQPVAWLQLAEGLPHELHGYLATQSFKCQANVLSLDLTQLPTTLPAIDIDLDDLAYIAFTSGTTGQPRAIRGTHRPLAHFGEWHSATFGLSSTDRFTMLSGLAHDPLLRDILTPLLVGATLYIPDGDALLIPNYVANWMAKHEISVTHLTPAMSQIISLSEQSLPTLRHAFFGGDRLTQQVVDSFQSCAPNARCVNFYGTTETPQAMAYHVIEAELNTAVSPIGKGIDGVQLLILTDTLQLAGVGELGQIGVRTPYLAEGYLDDVLTATKFIPNPFSSDASDRVYLTGDYGRYLPDGAVEFVGRMDSQVNIRGYRIELSEIEAVLTTHSQVTQAVVRLHEVQLVAYVVGETAVADTLNHYLQQRLPSYMQPSLFIPIEQLPLTPNGKVDYAQLPTPSRQSETEAITLPRTTTEIELVIIWQDLLQQSSEIGIEQDFFRLGGHSLLATQLLSRVQTIFDTAVPLTTFFAQPTIAKLAQFIDQAQRGTATPPLTTTEQRERLPLSFAQQRLWFLDQLDEAAFNIPLTLRLRGEIDVPLLTESINKIIERHTTLRTTFMMLDDQPVQQIRPFTPIQLLQINLTHLPEAERVNEAQTIATRESLHHFDLTQDCLLRAHLLQLGVTDFVLLLTIHHIAADGWSLGVLLDELTTIYTALHEKRPLTLPQLPIQYSDYAVWQREWLQGDVLDKQLNYWREQLTDVPAGLALPTDYPRDNNNDLNAELHRFALTPELTQQLKALSQQERSTLFMTLLTAFKIFLYRYTGQDDIVVGTPIANRNQQAIEKLIGFFVNTLVLRSQVDGVRNGR